MTARPASVLAMLDNLIEVIRHGLSRSPRVVGRWRTRATRTTGPTCVLVTPF